MKKLLFISNIAGKKISNFSIASIYASKELGYKFHYAANLNKSTLKQIENDEKKYNIKIHHIDIKRNPFNIKNIKAQRFCEVIKTVQADCWVEIFQFALPSFCHRAVIAVAPR